MGRYKEWTTKSGKKIPINKMTNTHLINAIKLLEQFHCKTIDRLITSTAFIHGEMAEMVAEQELNALMDRNDPSDIFPIYENMLNEAYKRGIDL